MPISRRETLKYAGLAALSAPGAALPRDVENSEDGREIVLSDDGGWCWFQDERALVADGFLYAGSVANGRLDGTRAGNVEVVRCRLATGEVTRAVLHARLQSDDHASPALISLPDGRILAAYSRHGNDNLIYHRTCKRPSEEFQWEDERAFTPSRPSRVTYSNLYWMARENRGRGRLYNFFRGLDDSFKPSWCFSDDLGGSWRTGGLLIDFPSDRRHRPYVKFASDGRNTIHLLFTEGHPNAYDNSIYHAVIRDGAFYTSAGEHIRRMSDGPITPADATLVWQGNAANVGWVHDLELDRRGEPRAVFSIQKDSAGLPSGLAGRDLRYRYARLDDGGWRSWEIAFAGERLYPGEDDYAGGISIHPDEPHTVFISTNVQPETGRKQAGARYEIYRGQTRDDGRSWKWTAITENSTTDNIRPIVPKWRRGQTALLWLRGRYRTYTRYELEVVLRLF